MGTEIGNTGGVRKVQVSKEDRRRWETEDTSSTKEFKKELSMWRERQEEEKRKEQAKQGELYKKREEERIKRKKEAEERRRSEEEMKKKTFEEEKREEKRIEKERALRLSRIRKYLLYVSIPILIILIWFIYSLLR